MISLNSRVQRNKNTAWRIIEGEGVLVDVDGGNMIHLNETAAEIWSLLDKNRAVSEIIDHICETFDVGKDTAKQDAVEFIENLLRNGIAECCCKV